MKPAAVRRISLTFVLLFAVIVGAAAGALSAFGGSSVPGAIMTGACGFAATTTLSILVLNFILPTV
ncbi:hypothetical protein JIG36_41760 [Actinoplanes sp. LDG1-06]|uniref:DUF1328 domain-containing protein n=1 Tax=Paractinoplanes ovalisporus TaxID=2810368 RepID=A0ABS2AQC2_9ACTN|nr:hypothetical protein [Actinoplanes ovalisporus]MBM2622050.1 hypothetical protein [Actinoplanes ovalisporus]